MRFKGDLEAAILRWIDNWAKSKKYASIGKELAEFKKVLQEGSDRVLESDSKAPAAPAKAGKKS